jgi:hypothetical protein
MAKERPDHHDAELLLRVYDLRREAVMRESRATILQKFWPKTYDDVAAVSQADHPLNAAFRQTGTYWEMVYNMVRHGIVHPEFFVESNGEGLFLFARVAPHVERFRKELSPTAFLNAEWVSEETAAGRRYFETFTARVQKALASR